MFQSEEQKLIRQALAGDKDAIERLYKIHFHRTRAVISNCAESRDQDDTEESVRVLFTDALWGWRGSGVKESST